MSSVDGKDASPGSSPTFWRSMDQLADAPEFRRFVENEFPAYADQMLTPPSRRNFLKIMGASLALAGMTGCRWPKEEILPFADRPDGYVPGTRLRYATAMDVDGVATGLLVTSYDGRPIKIEGNPESWSSQGATNAWHQAGVLELYDPERSQYPKKNGSGETGWLEFDAFVADHFDQLASDGGRKLRFLVEPSSSPSRERMRRRVMKRFPRAAWCEYTPVSRDNARDGAAMALGRPMRTHLSLDRAETILSIDDDFLTHHPATVRYSRDFAAGRNPEGDFNRLWMVESRYSLTGSVADRRVALSPGRIPAFTACVAAALFLEHGVPLPAGAAGLRPLLESVRGSAIYSELDLSVAAELAHKRGASVVTVGPRQPAEVHALAHVINDGLRNVGRTVSYTLEPDDAREHHSRAIRALADEMAAGKVDTLVVLGGNPVWDAPRELDLGGLIDKIPTSIHLSLYDNETSAACSWHLPRAHFLESWGDGRDYRGGMIVAQPLIRPLYEGRTDTELLARMAGQRDASAYELVRATFFDATDTAGDERAWSRALHDGAVAGTEWPEAESTSIETEWAAGLERLLADPDPADGELELLCVEDPKLLDGRWANNGWLQEMPDPITKLTWDNAALISPATAKALGVWQEDVVRLTVDGRSAELPVFVMPGQPERTVVASLGYGRTAAGSVGNGVGVDLYPLRGAAGWSRARVESTGRSYTLATTQNHFAIDELGAKQREIRVPQLVREAELADYRHDPEHALHHHGHELIQLWKPFEYDGYKWGMTIDLNACTGCSTCIVACQAENNIPIVGKAEVAEGREMHWLRVDRYFKGEQDNPEMVHQPVPCQHCENAPCEQVCPVAATVHDSEGLNVMVYNRCVGTRYCSNNCPYKVRRFNYFNNNKNTEPVRAMAHNPDVTLRFRGVMEKCTFCVQRISAAKITAKNEGRKVRDGEVVPACAQVCPTRAIRFGDLNDANSVVAEEQKDVRSYVMLEETNVRPRVKYMARLRNSGHGDAGDHEGAA